MHAYAALEERIRASAARTGEIAKYVPTKKVITQWLSPDGKDSPAFETSGEINDWRNSRPLLCRVQTRWRIKE